MRFYNFYLMPRTVAHQSIAHNNEYTYCKHNCERVQLAEWPVDRPGPRQQTITCTHHQNILTSSGSVPSCLALNPTIEKTTILANIDVQELVKQTIRVSINELLDGFE